MSYGRSNRRGEEKTPQSLYGELISVNNPFFSIKEGNFIFIFLPSPGNI